MATVREATTKADIPPQEMPIGLLGLFLNGLQHVAIIAPIGLVFPLLVLRAADVDHVLHTSVICASLVALGIGSLLLCRRGRLGSGYLSPAVFTAAYLPGSLLAAQIGGLPLVFGMTLFAGLCELGFSFLMRRLRAYLPAEIAGLAVVMIGIILGLLGFRLLLGIEGRAAASAEGVDMISLAIGLLALALIVGFNIWGKGPLRTFSVLIGLALTYPLAAALGKMDMTRLDLALGDGLVTLPSLPLLLPSFDLTLVPTFAIGALACALRATGDITTCQKIADPDWVRPDMRSIERGVRADGIGTMLAGLLGTVGMNTFSGSVGLSQATGVLQRRVGLAIAAIFVALAFLPPVVGIAAAMPAPLSGAILLFSSAFILANGLGIIVGRLLDSRRILAIGVALILGISHDVFLEFYRSLPPWLRSVSGSSLLVAMVVALTLNAVFRIGVKRSATLEQPLETELLDAVVAFCRQQGPLWGARRDVMDRVVNALTEATEMAYDRGVAGTPVTLRLNYDEFHIDAEMRFAMRPLDPDEGNLEEKAVAALGSAALELRLMRHFADRVSTASEDGHLKLRLRFEA